MWTYTSTKNIIWIANRPMKKCLTLPVIREKCKSKLQWNVLLTIHLLEFHKLKYLNILRVGKDMEPLRMQNSITIFEMDNFLKVTQPSHSYYEVFIHPREDLFMKVHSSFICNSQKLETIRMSTNTWMDEL